MQTQRTTRATTPIRTKAPINGKSCARNPTSRLNRAARYAAINSRTSLQVHVECCCTQSQLRTRVLRVLCKERAC